MIRGLFQRASRKDLEMENVVLSGFDPIGHLFIEVFQVLKVVTGNLWYERVPE